MPAEHEPCRRRSPVLSVIGLVASIALAALGAPTVPVRADDTTWFTLQDPDVDEASGAVLLDDRYLLTHNDRGASTATLFTIDTAGATVARTTLDGIVPTDLEAIAAGPGLDGTTPSIWVADIGDNQADRDSIALYVLPRSSLATPGSAESPGTATVAATTVRLAYGSDGPHNAESLVVHPVTGQVAIVTKTDGEDGVASVHLAPRRLDVDVVNPLRRIARLDLSDPEPVPREGDDGVAGAGRFRATDAVASVDAVHVRTYGDVLVFGAPTGAMHDLAQPWLSTPSRTILPNTPQGEGLTLTSDASTWVTTSERAGSAVHRVPVAAATTPIAPSCAPIPNWTRPQPPTATRLAGQGRYATAVAVAAEGWPTGANVVVVASGTSAADALSAGVAAGRVGAPLLLTAADALPPVVADELTRLAPTTIVLVGGRAAVGDAVADALSDIAPTTRVAGPSRYETAIAVAAWSDEASGRTATEAVVASGVGFADAVAAAPFAQRRDAVLLLSRPDGLPAAVAEAVDGFGAGWIIGGAAALSDEVLDAVDAQVDVATRLAGSDRYATAACLAGAGVGRAGSTDLYVVTGEAFPDALTAGALAAGAASPVLLVPRGGSVEQPAAVAARWCPERLVVIGGTSAVPDAQVAALSAAVAETCA